MIETVGDLDNVLYEISNESRPGSAAWQYHMIRFIHDREAHRAKRHPVGMTVEYPGGDNQALVDSPADWISPRGMAWDPPATDGRKVIVWDTDHVGGLKTNPDAAWRAFTRGANPLLMDPFDSTARDMDIHLGPEYRPDEPLLVTARRTLGQTLALATQMHLERMVPRPDLATTGYCLADTARGRGEYLAYLPEGGRVTLDLGGARDVLAVRWFSPSRGETYDAGTVRGGNRSTLRAPFRGPAVLFLFAAAPDPPEPSP